MDLKPFPGLLEADDTDVCQSASERGEVARGKVSQAPPGAQSVELTLFVFLAAGSWTCLQLRRGSSVVSVLRQALDELLETAGGLG